MKNNFIGSGITFPILLDKDGKAIINNDVKLINSSIMTIINWPYAHRFFNEKFGCRIFELLEEPNDDISKTLISHFITDAISMWEKRVIMNNSGVKIVRFDNTKVDIEIRYRINATKTEETFIFPFYKEITF